MTTPRRPKALAAHSIFINCPFDDAFEPILRAMVFAIIVSGYHPRCALDATDGAEVRIGKIAAMIGACDWGIHDLSRVEVVAGDVPRFNMPLELGLHLGARRFGDARQRRKRALILDGERHRYDRALSDISGQDIESHGDDPAEAIRCVRNWLSDHRPHNAAPLPGAKAMQEDYLLFQSEIDALLVTHRLDPASITHSDYLYVVGDWLRLQASRRSGPASI